MSPQLKYFVPLEWNLDVRLIPPLCRANFADCRRSELYAATGDPSKIPRYRVTVAGRCSASTVFFHKYLHHHHAWMPVMLLVYRRPISRIAQYVSSLIKDGDTIQVGQGGTSEALIRAGLLDNKQDVGWHSEVTPGGIVRLVMKGVITGRRKSIDRGKALATAIGGGTMEEMSFVHLNPMFELRDMEYTHDPRVISQLDNIVTINNALEVDLTGQVNAESRGPHIFSGAGGLLAFSIGAHLAKNGRSIIVLPSGAQGGTISRIVPMLSSKVTVPHTLADYIVTEWGIARLRGKTQRQRAEEIIAVAHPDFQSELRKAAQNLYWP